MANLVILDYSSLDVIQIQVPQKIYDKHKHNPDELVYNILGYKESQVSYMIGNLKEKHFNEEELQELYEKAEENTDN